MDSSVSTLKWHLEVLKNFDVINWTQIGQYQVIFLSGSIFDKKLLRLYYSMISKDAEKLLKLLISKNKWLIGELLTASNLSYSHIEKFLELFSEAELVSREQNGALIVVSQFLQKNFFKIREKKKSDFTSKSGSFAN
jgi:predicted transcriptional regulator